MACVVVEGETGLLGQQYVPEAQAHRMEGAHMYTREHVRGWCILYDSHPHISRRRT